MTDFFVRLSALDRWAARASDESWDPDLSSIRALLGEPASAQYLIDVLPSEPHIGVRLATLTASFPSDVDPALVHVGDILREGALDRLADSDPRRAPTPRTLRQLQLVLSAIENVSAEGAGHLPPELQELLQEGLARVGGATLRPTALGRAIVACARQHGFRSAEALLRAAGFPTSQGQRRRDAWWASELLDGCLVDLCELDPVQGYEYFLSALLSTLREDDSLDKTSSIWLPEITESSDASTVEGVLAAAAHRAALVAIMSGALPSDLIFQSLWDNDSFVLRRLSMSLAFRGGSQAVDHAVRVISAAHEAGLSYELEREFRDLMGQVFGDLPPEAQHLYFEWVERSSSKFLAMDGTKGERQRAADLWKRDWYDIVEDELEPPRLEELGAWRSKYPEDTGRWSRGLSVGWVEQVSPVAASEVVAWTPDDLADQLLAARDALRRAGNVHPLDFHEVSMHGLIEAMSDALLVRRGDWLQGWDAVHSVDEQLAEALIHATERAVHDHPEEFSRAAVWQLLSSAERARLHSGSARRSLAMIGQRMVETGWTAAADTNRYLAFSRWLIDSPEDGRHEFEDRDPSLAAINSDDGIAAGTACFAYLRAVEQDVADDESVTLGHDVLGRALVRGVPRLHAAVGRWTSALVALDGQWFQRAQHTLFPEDEVLFSASWGAYLRYGQLRRNVYQHLEHEYLRSIRRSSPEVDPDSETGRRLAEETRSLTEHLLVVAIWGETPTTHPGPLHELFGDLSEYQRSHAHEFVAREAQSPDLNDELLERMQRILEWRVRTAPPDRELEWITEWCRAPVEPDWLLPLLLSSADKVPRFADPEPMLTWLQELDGTWAVQAIPLLHKVCATADPWDLSRWADGIRELLLRVLVVGTSQHEVAEIADCMGRRGHYASFRDVYAAAARGGTGREGFG